jgi:hypothetical protein
VAVGVEAADTRETDLSPGLGSNNGNRSKKCRHCLHHWHVLLFKKKLRNKNKSYKEIETGIFIGTPRQFAQFLIPLRRVAKFSMFFIRPPTQNLTNSEIDIKNQSTRKKKREKKKKKKKNGDPVCPKRKAGDRRRSRHFLPLCLARPRNTRHNPRLARRNQGMPGTLFTFLALFYSTFIIEKKKKNRAE